MPKDLKEEFLTILIQTYQENIWIDEINLLQFDEVLAKQQLDGTDLCQRYNKPLEPIVAERASLSKFFSDCCANLHNRTGRQDEFKKGLELMEVPFKLIENLMRCILI